jgi:hypothetical protein
MPMLDRNRMGDLAATVCSIWDTPRSLVDSA